jgi:hypothetical protein
MSTFHLIRGLRRVLVLVPVAVVLCGTATADAASTPSLRPPTTSTGAVPAALASDGSAFAVVWEAAIPVSTGATPPSP